MLLLITNVFESSAEFKSSLDKIPLCPFCQRAMTHSFAVPHKLSAWVAVARGVIETCRIQNDYTAHFKSPGKGEGDGGVNTSSPDVMPSNIYAYAFPNV